MLSVLRGLLSSSKDPLQLWGDKLGVTVLSSKTSTDTVEGAAFEGFKILQKKLLETADQVSTLKNLKNWKLEVLLEADPSLRAKLEKICPQLLLAEESKRNGVIDHALKPLAEQESALYGKIVEWLFYQPDIAKFGEDELFKSIPFVSGALTSNNKIIYCDPLIPLFKIAIRERVKWNIKRIPRNDPNFHNRLFAVLAKEVGQILPQIPDMYYNTFLGPDHPKVQENLEHQNDLVPITADDVREHIIELQLKAAMEILP